MLVAVVNSKTENQYNLYFFLIFLLQEKKIPADRNISSYFLLRENIRKKINKSILYFIKSFLLFKFNQDGKLISFFYLPWLLSAKLWLNTSIVVDQQKNFCLVPTLEHQDHQVSRLRLVNDNVPMPTKVRDPGHTCHKDLDFHVLSR